MGSDNFPRVSADKDRALLDQLATLKRNLGQVIIELCDLSADGKLPADGLRVLGEHLVALGADLLARAAELDRPVINADGGEQP